MKEFLQLYTSKLLSLTYFINSEIITLIWDNRGYMEEPYKYLYSLLFKTINSLDTANILFLNVIDKPSTTDSLFIINRTLLSDLVLYDYLFRSSKNDTELLENIQCMYCDHVYRQIIEMKSFYTFAYQENPLNVEDLIGELKVKYSECFDSDGNNAYTPKGFTVSRMCSYILSNKLKDEELPHIIRAKELYDVFSKFEHFGQLSFTLTHRHFNNENIDQVVEEILMCFRIVLKYVDEIVQFWIDKNNDLYKKFNKMYEEIIELRP